MRIKIFVLAILLTVCGSANADISSAKIKAYNDALLSASSATDIRQASEALGAEAIANPDDESATLLAFEAAWTLCRIGACDKAAEAAAFAAGQPTTDPAAYPTPETRAVLSSFITWNSDPTNRHRKSLSDALDQLAENDITNVSIAAHKAHYDYCTAKEKWGDALKAATAAAAHLETAQDEIFVEFADARLTQHAASFNKSQNAKSYEGMVALERDINTRLAGLDDNDETAAQLQQIGHQAMAWRGAISAYLRSTGSTRKVDTINAKYEAPADDGAETAPAAANSEDGLPFCGGGFIRAPTVSYPEGAARAGIVGSLVMGLSLNEDGRPTDVEVLASVPTGIFDEAAVRAIELLEWAPAEGTDLASCRLARENIVYPFVFRLD